MKYNRAKRGLCSRHPGICPGSEELNREGEVMKKQWTRRRWFVGRVSNSYKVFSCWYEPTRNSHGHKYLFCFGPYRTKKRAIQIRNYQS